MNIPSSSQCLDNNILIELDKLNIGCVKKRIVCELVDFKKKDAYVNVEYKEHINNSTIVVTIIPNDENNIYHFTIAKNYPYRPPIKFCINYKDYKQYLKIDSRKTINELQIYNNIQCLCCSTICCGCNWSPALRMQSCINEFKQLKKYRRDIINRLLSKKIINKYLISDINLDEWLF